MIVLALLLAGAAPAVKDRGSSQIMNSPSFNAFAARSERVCPGRRLRNLRPAELDGVEERYFSTLSRAQNRRITAIDKGWRGCPPAGASCPAQHMLWSVDHEHLLGSFVSFACRTKP